MQTLSDIALITQVVAFGSQRAFGRLVERHQEAVRRFLLRLTGGDAMRADDIAQETFIHAWQHLDSFRQMSAFQTWLLSIAYRAFLDDERKSTPTCSTLEPSSSQSPLPDSSLSIPPSPSHLSIDIDKALATLSETERTCVVLQCIEGHSIREIAQITHLNENTVKSHLLRGKKNLATFLCSNGY